MNDDDVKQSVHTAVDKATDMGEVERRVVELAAISPFEYDKIRMEEAKRLGVRLTTLDSEVNKRRIVDDGQGGTQGQPVILTAPEPWPEEVRADELFSELADFLNRHVVLPRCAADVAALWTAGTYCIDKFRSYPRLAVMSPEPQCGKSTFLDVLAMVMYKPLKCSSVTPSALYRVVEAFRPSLLLDEGDSFVSTSEQLRGILNTSYERGGKVIVSVGDDHEPKTFECYCAMVLAAIKSLPETVLSRSLLVSMRRATAEERASIVRITRQTDAEAAVLARKLARWANDAISGLDDPEPAMPDHLFNREADKWRPLFAIAERAGDEWIGRTIAAERTLSDNDYEVDSLGVQLLTHIKVLFDEQDVDGISGDLLVRLLNSHYDWPWADLRYGSGAGTGLTENHLRRMLKPYGVQPRQRWSGEPRKNRRQYVRSDLEKVWVRYVPESVRGHVEKRLTVREQWRDPEYKKRRALRLSEIIADKHYDVPGELKSEG